LLVLGGADGRLALSISAAGLVVALLSALTAAFNTLVAVPLIKHLGPWATINWGMLVGGLAVAGLTPPWRIHASGDPLVVAALATFVVLIGTTAAFSLYFASLRHIAPTDAAIAVTFEPVTAAIASLVLLHIALHPAQYLGGALILMAVVLLRRDG
jgi:drug/metabolite transporter (DMT)-like permease